MLNFFTNVEKFKNKPQRFLLPFHIKGQHKPIDNLRKRKMIMILKI